MSLPHGFKCRMPPPPAPPATCAVPTFSAPAPAGLLPVPRPRLSGLHVLLIATTSCLMLTILALAVVLLKRPVRSADGPTSPLPQPEAVVPTPPDAPALPPARSASSPARAVLPPPERLDRGTPPAEDPKPLWTAIGGLTRAHLYQSQLSIGLLADGVEEELYTLSEARKLLANLTELLEQTEADLGRLPDTGLLPEERRLFGQVRGLFVLLRAQAWALSAYWDEGDKASAERFHKAREAAGKKLREVLG